MKTKINSKDKSIAMLLWKAFFVASVILINSFHASAQCPLPGPVPGLTGFGRACPGQSKVYSHSASTNATAYIWNLPAGCTIAGQNPYTTSLLSVTVDFGITFVPPGTISVRGTNICGNGNPNSKNVTAYFPSVPSSISGNYLACPGDNNIYSVTAEPDVIYNWVMPAGVTLNSGQGTNTINVTFTGAFISTGNMTVTGNYGCGPSGARTKQIFVNSVGSPGLITGSEVACEFQTNSYSIAPVANATNYNWVAPVGSTITGQGTANVDVTFPAGFVQGDVTVQTQNGCGVSNTIHKHVRARPTIPGLISGPASGICNATHTYSVAPIFGTTSYGWTPPAGGSIISGQGTTSCTISFTGTINDSVKVNATNACGTSVNRRLFVTSNIIISQQPIGNAFCQFTQMQLVVVVPGGDITYQWRKDGLNVSNGPNITGADDDTLTILVIDSLDAGDYDVIISSACASSVTSAIATVTVNMLPPTTADIIGPHDSCPTTTVICSVPVSTWNTLSYDWEALGGANIIAGQGTDSVTVELTTNTGNYSGYTILCWGVNACGRSIDSAYHWIRHSVSIPTFASGPTKVCQGQTNVDYVINPVVDATSYTWSVTSTDISINSGQGTLTLNVDFSPTFTAGHVCVTASNACMTTDPRCRSIIFDIPNAPGNITGQTYAACGTTLTYSISAMSGVTSYTWTPPAGATISSGQGTTSVDIDFGGAFTTGQITVAGISACDTGSVRTKNVYGVPDKPGTITPSTGVFCANQTGITFTIAAVTGATNYLWTVPTGATITAGAGTTSITVDLGSTDGNVGVRAQNACGNSGTSTFFVDITCRLANQGAFGSKIGDFDVYPNPASDKVLITYNSNSDETYEILLTDIVGKKISRITMQAVSGINNSEMDLREITPGIYFIVLQSADEIKQMKIVVE